jgi:flagellar hook-associated protein 1 FlgK
MSISSSLNNAISGLMATSRAADVVSSNVANAMTEGYGVRGLELGTLTNGRDGAGVRVVGVVRDSDPVLVGQRRGADAGQARAAAEANFRRQIEDIIGLPNEPNSLSAQLAEFEARLFDAANRPQDEIGLGAAIEAAEQLARGFRDASDGVQAERQRADSAIGAAVATINDSLAGIAELNTQILATRDASGELATYLDAQARLVDQISPLIAVETRRDANGALQVFSSGGEILLDRRAAVLEFETAPAIEPTMIYGESILLSGITIRGRDIPFGEDRAQLGGGELEALFAIRDTWGTDAQAKLDGMARNLVERFEMSTFDTTRTPFVPPAFPTDAGLFTDDGGPIAAAIDADPLAEQGLASRLAVNDQVRPSHANGDVRRLRDGMYFDYASPLPHPAVGDPTYLSAQIDLLAVAQPVVSGGFASGSRSMSGLMSDHVSMAAQSRQRAEMTEANRVAIQSSLRQQELARGVDTDVEMQNLLRIENADAANARVIQAAEAMLDELMRMT